VPRRPPGSAPRRRFKALTDGELRELVHGLEERREFGETFSHHVNYDVLDHLVVELEAEQVRRQRRSDGSTHMRSRGGG
jgi:hypothetical protein